MPEGTVEISVVIPGYGRVELLTKTLDSILAQTYPVREIVAVDDGSPIDMASALAEQYGDRVRWVRQDNAGLNSARNRGVAESRFPWVAICDSDDLWHPEKLERQVTLLSHAPDARFCATDFRMFSDAGDLQNHYSFAPDGFWDVPRRDFGDAGFVVDCKLYDRYLDFQPVHPSTLLIHRDMLERVGPFDESLSRWAAEDFEFHLRCSAYPPFAFVPIPLVRYRRHANSLSADRLSSHSNGADILEYALRHHAEAQRNPERVQSVIRRTLIESAEMAYYLERLDQFRSFIARVPDPPMKLRALSATAALPMPLHRLLRQTLRLVRGKPLRTAPTQ
jgi:glycosyltransferase involved in cell wall biosynthesis